MLGFTDYFRWAETNSFETSVIRRDLYLKCPHLRIKLLFSIRLYTVCCMNYISISFRGEYCKILNGSYISGDFNAKLDANITVRNDIGKINTPPTTAMMPVLFLRRNRTLTINIPGSFYIQTFQCR